MKVAAWEAWKKHGMLVAKILQGNEDYARKKF